MAYIEDKLPDGLDAITSTNNADVFIVGDNSDSDRAKKITKANLVTDLYAALGTSLDADYQPLDAQLTSIAGLTPGAEGRMITSDGLGGYQISTPAGVRSYLNVEDGADVTDATNVDAAGATMNTDTNVGGNSWVLQDADSDAADDTKVGSWTKTRNYVAGEVSDAAPSYSCGQTSRVAASGTGTQNIAHGLGKTPSLIVIKASGITSSNLTHTISRGSATSTSDETCTYDVVASVGSVEGAYQSTGYILELSTSSGTTASRATLSALDATNITLNFTTHAGVDVYIQWEAFA